jgi:hypothetical protein
MTDRVRLACEANWAANRSDCSGFVRAVVGAFGVTLVGVADEIVDALRAGGSWRALAGGPAAAQSAARGRLVVAGLRGDEQSEPSAHGHVVIIVAGPLSQDAYPLAYWGRLGGSGEKEKTINWAWRSPDRDRVSYAEQTI